MVANALADDTREGMVARAALRRDPDLAAPDLVDVETVSVLRTRWLADDLDAERFRMAVADLGDLPVDRYPTLDFMARAYELRANVTPYDSAYIALGETLGCALLTADARLAGARGPRCEIRVLRAPPESDSAPTGD